MQNNKVLAVCRVSSDRQDTHSQRVDLEKYLKSKGFEDKDIVWLERTASATKLNDEYENLIDDIKSICTTQHIKNVAVWHLNRLGRRELPLMEIKTFFLENEINLLCKTPDFQLFDKETGKPNRISSLIYNLWIEFIKSETEERQEKLRRGILDKLSMGKYTGGPILYGYSVDSDNNYVINPEESQIIQQIFEMYLSGRHSLNSIAKEFTAKDIKRRNENWSPSTVQHALKSGLYSGKPTRHGLVYPAFISESQYVKVNEMLSGNDNQVKFKTKERTRVNLANSLIYCKHCNRKYIANIRSYMCVTQRSYKHLETCPAHHINYNLLEDLLMRLSIHLHINYLSRHTEREKEKLEAECQELKELLAGAENRLKTVKANTEKLEDDFYVEARISESRFEQLIAKNTQKQQSIEAEIETYSNRLKVLYTRLAMCENSQMIHFPNYTAIRDLENREAKKELKELVHAHITRIDTDRDEVSDELTEEQAFTYLAFSLADMNQKIYVRYRLPLTNQPAGSDNPCIWIKTDVDKEWEVLCRMGRNGKKRVYMYDENIISWMVDSRREEIQKILI